jgi:hypothetical protein
VSFIFHNSLGFLVLFNYTRPIGLIVWVTDAVIFVPLVVISIVGMRKTDSSKEKTKILNVIFWSSVLYFGLLWAINSLITGTPPCPEKKGFPDE